MQSIRGIVLSIVTLLCGIFPLLGHSEEIAANKEDNVKKESLSKGREKSLGLTGGYSTYNSSGYVGVNFQYEFVKHFRLSPSIGYSIKNDNKSAILIDIDMHFPFRVLKGFTLYPLAGISYNNWTIGEVGNHSNYSRFGGNLGGGFDIYFTSYFKLEIQGKYSWMKDTSGGFFGVGLFYIF